MKYLLILLLLLTAGCKSQEQRFAEYRDTCNVKYNFDYGSDGMKQCVVDLDLAYEREAAAFIRANAICIPNVATGGCHNK